MAGYVEAVSGETYQQYMIDHFFKPLGMNDTNWTYTKSMIANEATGAAPSFDIQALLLPLVLEKDKIEDLVREESDGILWFNHIYTDQKGPTGPIGSATDAARFVMAFLNGGELDGQRILSEESVAQITYKGHVQFGDTSDAADFQKYDESYQGIGWVYAVDGNDYFLSHSGGGPGFSANMRLYPERGIGLVVLANGTYLPREEIFDLVASLNWQ